jgi:hypothetical protein
VPFKPSVHGWPFPNALQPDGPALGLGAPPRPELGLGAGMCWAALDRYLGSVRLSRDIPLPRPGDPLHTEILGRHASALSGIWPRVREWQRLTDREVGFRTRATWRGLRDELTAGHPVLLTVLLESDPYRRAQAVAHVLAIGCLVVEDRAILSVYDPARPDDDEIRLGFALVGPPNTRLSGRNTIRGFFPVPYDRSRPVPEQLESFADRDVLELARPVRGRVAVAASGARLELVARSPAGGLLHFRRRRWGPWQGQVVMEPVGSGFDELQGDPSVLLANGRVHAFARSYVGDLIHFQRGLRWAVANRTAHERTGPRYRLAGQPVPTIAPNGGVSVFGRDPAGGIVHYAGTRLGRWHAERLPEEPIVGDPLVARPGGALHLFGVTSDGRVVHWERGEEEWTVQDVMATSRYGPAIRLEGKPVLFVRDETTYLFGRDLAGQLVHCRRTPAGHWNSVTHSVEIAAPPVAVTGPGGIHVFAPGADGGLVHRWGDTVWHGEDVTGSRAGMGVAGPLRDAVHAWGTPAEMRVFGRWGDVLTVLTWREDADWTAVPLGDRSGIDPRRLPSEAMVLALDGKDRPHLFGTDDKGTVVHIEQGPWVEPAPLATSGLRDEAPETTTVAEAEAVATGEPAGATTPAGQPAAPGAPGAPAAPGADRAGVDPKPAEPRPAEPEPAEPKPAEPRPAGLIPADQAPDGPVPAVIRPIGLTRWPDHGESPETIPEKTAASALPEASVVTPEVAGPALTPEPEAPVEVELMDLSLLDTWPEQPRPRRMRRGELQG